MQNIRRAEFLEYHNYCDTHAAKCPNVLHQLGQAQDNIQVIGYSDPALEGTVVTLECSSPNLVHMGPNTTTCMGNGEWEPDPRDMNCAGEIVRFCHRDIKYVAIIYTSFCIYIPLL